MSMNIWFHNFSVNSWFVLGFGRTEDCIGGWTLCAVTAYLWMCAFGIITGLSARPVGWASLSCMTFHTKHNGLNHCIFHLTAQLHVSLHVSTRGVSSLGLRCSEQMQLSVFSVPVLINTDSKSLQSLTEDEHTLLLYLSYLK